MRLLLVFITSASITVILATTSQASPPLLDTADLFLAKSNGIALHRIPGIVVTTKGTVLAYCEARKNSGSDWGEIAVHMRRSTDGGKTWDKARPIAHMGDRVEGNPTKARGGEREQTVNNPVAIVDRQTGAIEFLYCINYARCFSMRSTDDGETWSKPTEITSAFEPFRTHYPWNVIATGPGHGIQTSTGRLVVPVWIAYGKKGNHHPSAAGTIYSDDHGKTWKAGDIAVPNTPPFGDPNETTIAPLSNGSVVLITRNESKANRKIITISPDGAHNWNKPEFHNQLWEPICMAGLIAHPSKPGTLLFSSARTLAIDASGKEVPGGRGKRQNLSIQLSRDDGKTWPVNKTVEPGASAYSDLAVLPDGSVICLYEAKDKIKVARFNLEWLTD